MTTVLWVHGVMIFASALVAPFLFGILNLLFRRPFFDRWRMAVLYVVVWMVGMDIPDFTPKAWRVPFAAAECVFLLAFLFWARRRPNSSRKPDKVNGGTD